MTEQEIQALKDERDALKEKVQLAERIKAIFNDAPELTFDDCLDLFPEQVRELQAEAGRTGYLIGANYVNDCIFEGKVIGDIDLLAEEHAESVRQGGE